MAFDWGSFLGQNIGEAFAKIVGAFKVPPEAALAAQTETMKVQAELQAKILDQVNNEVSSATEIIKAEANSQSWIARNVRPLLLLIWGLTISVNAVAPIAGHWLGIQQVALDPWVYKLTAIGFTGYVTARTWEKVTNSDK